MASKKILGSIHWSKDESKTVRHASVKRILLVNVKAES